MTQIVRRRSRMHRQRTGRRIEITSRDLEIFRLLCGYRYLPSTYIHAFVGGASETRFKERLGHLFHQGYLDRPEQQWRFADARCRPVVHESGNGANRTLATLSDGLPRRRTFLGPLVHHQFIHSLLICEVLASIELGVRAKSDLRFITWSELLARAPAETQATPKPFAVPVPGSSEVLLPDALFGLEYSGNGRKSYRFFALEIDRGTMPASRSDRAQTSYLAKLDSYGRIVSHKAQKEHLGISTLFILTVTTREAHMREIMRKLMETGRTSSVFLFKALSLPGLSSGLTRPRPELLFEPWQRVGQTALDITAP